jgi:LuxR family transcriptional regulator, regulator of acetate metabolism
MSSGEPATAERESLVTVAETALDQVRQGLQRPPGERPPGIAELDEELRAVGERLRASLLDADREEPAAIGQRLELIFEVGELREELRARDLFERLDVLARIDESVLELRNCKTPAELIETAPRELCRSCGFTRALISRVHGSRWVPEVIETIPGMDPEAERFAEYVHETEIQLDHMLLETELVRRRMPALVTDPANDPRTHKPIILRGRTTAYVAAPIMPTGRVIGFLHADRIGQEHPVTPEDRDNLWAFAEQFGFLYERAVLLERLDAQRAQLHQAFAGTERVVEELWHQEIELTRSEHNPPEVTRTAAALFRAPESRLDGLMTRREREVLELMTSGATNTRIAEQLVISEGTVKSHVKHILRKLRAANRAEAVARYLQILLREQQDRGRR